MKMKLLLYLSIGVGLLSACDDAFLDQYPKDQLSESNFWQTPKDAEMFVNDMYTILPGDMIGSDTRSDNAVYGIKWAEEDIAKGIYDPLDGTFSGHWSYQYGRIRKVNVYFENVEKIPDLDPAQKKRLDAQAKFFRAWSYFELAKVFAGVPIVLKSLTVDETYDVERASLKEVIELIQKDLTEAAADLPESWPGEYGKITKGTALAFKARVELFFINNNDAGLDDALAQAAEQDAKAVIDLGIYHLFKEDVNGDGEINDIDYKALFNTSYPGDPQKAEMILETQFVKDLRGNGYNTWNAPPPMGWGGINPTQSFVDEFETINGLTISEDPAYDDAHPFDNRDPRLEVCVWHHGEEFVWLNRIDTMKTRPVPEDAPMGIGTHGDATSTGYYQQKFFQADEDMRDGAKDSWNSPYDWPVIRYAEVLLTYAEARVWQDKIDDETYSAIDEVRTRVGMPPVDRAKYASKDDMIKLLIRENRAEFGMEGKRWLDVRHYGIDVDVLVGQYYGMKYDPATQTAFVGEPIPSGVPRIYSSHNRLWPIPQDERTLNPKLEQNPGY